MTDIDFRVVRRNPADCITLCKLSPPDIVHSKLIRYRSVRHVHSIWIRFSRIYTLYLYHCDPRGRRKKKHKSQIRTKANSKILKLLLNNENKHTKWRKSQTRLKSKTDMTKWISILLYIGSFAYQSSRFFKGFEVKGLNKLLIICLRYLGNHNVFIVRTHLSAKC